MAEAVLVIDAKGEILLANPAAGKMLRYQAGHERPQLRQLSVAYHADGVTRLTRRRNAVGAGAARRAIRRAGNRRPPHRRPRAAASRGQRPAAARRLRRHQRRGAGLPRHHRLARNRAQAAAVAETRRHRQAHRRRRARLQQHADRDHRHHRNAGRGPAEPAGAAEDRRADRPGGRTLQRADPASARLRPPPAAASAQCRHQRHRARYRQTAAPDARRADRDQLDPRAGSGDLAYRPLAARELRAQHGDQRPRRDAERRQAVAGDPQRRARRSLCAGQSGRAARPLCDARGQRHRHRHVQRGAGQGVRAVLHHQGGRQGLRARA